MSVIFPEQVGSFTAAAIMSRVSSGLPVRDRRYRGKKERGPSDRKPLPNRATATSCYLRQFYTLFLLSCCTLIRRLVMTGAMTFWLSSQYGDEHLYWLRLGFL